MSCGINDRDQTWRIAYYVGADAIVILEVFSKKTGTTPKSVIEKCRRRLRQYLKIDGDGDE